MATVPDVVVVGKSGVCTGIAGAIVTLGVFVTVFNPEVKFNETSGTGVTIG